MSLRFDRAANIPGLAEAFAIEQPMIRAAVPSAEVLHTGASSIDGLLTLGDLDIHVRVDEGEFSRAASALETLYAPYRPAMWTDGFAAFQGSAGNIPVGVALTAIDGEHDRRFRRGWQRIAADPALVDEYNALKLRHVGGNAEAYEAEKSDFFSRLADE